MSEPPLTSEVESTGVEVYMDYYMECLWAFSPGTRRKRSSPMIPLWRKPLPADSEGRRRTADFLKGAISTIQEYIGRLEAPTFLTDCDPGDEDSR